MLLRQAELVQQWQQSGESAEVFAKRHKFRVESLMLWAARFDRREAKRTPGEKVGFVPVTILDDASAASDTELLQEDSTVAEPEVVPTCPPPEPIGLVVEVGHFQLRVQRGFDALLLKQVLDVLGGC